MTGPRRLPRFARWLLRLSPVPRDARGEVESDLYELFVTRRSDRGGARARWRLYHDVASLWFHARPMTHTASPPRSPFAFLRDISGDVKYAARLYARQPAILVLTITGLSLGLGIATAAFSIMNAAALRGEGLVDPERAPAVLRTIDRSTATVWTYDEFVRLREGATRMQVEAVVTDSAPARTDAAAVEGPPAGVAFVSGGFFAAAGARVTLGRALEPADERHAGPPPVVVSRVFWSARLNRDPSVLGRTIRIGRTDATIVGVADRGFSLPNSRMLWMPLTAYNAVYGGAVSGVPATVDVFARLLPEVSIAEAEAQLSGVAAALPRDTGTSQSPLGVRLDPEAGLGRVPAADAAAIASLVFGVIGLVLLLACANVATVLVSTALTREREMGVRAALGASRGRIVRQLVTESLVLGTLASTLGLLFAHWAIPTIATMIEAPAGADLAPDLTVFVFLGVVTLVSGIGAGLAPAWHGRGVDLVTPLKGDGAQPGRLAPRRLRSLLVVAQAAASVLLIVLASLFVRATFNAAAIDVGFDAEGLYSVSAGDGRADADGAATRAFWARAISDVANVPGVAAVTLSELTPFDGLSRTSLARDGSARRVSLHRARADYFETMGLRVIAGRGFTPAEVASKAPVALISASLARAYFGDRSPLGQVVPEQIPLPASTRPVIIGVAADAITARLHQRNAFAIYEPLDPPAEVFARMLIRTAPGATGAMEQAVQRLRSIDPQADVRVASVAAQLEQEASRPRMLATLTGTVGAIAIILCVIGLYGLTASVVGQRTREMGIRMAIGADKRALFRMLMWDSLRPVVIGLAAGGGAALLASRIVVAAMFFGLSPQDPMAYAGAAATLLVAALLAVVIPTRRAAGADAVSVLRRL